MTDREEMTVVSPNPAQTPARIADVSRAIDQIAQAMQSLANMVRTTNERMAALEQSARLLTKVTPAQAGAINAAIRDRARELCAAYHAAGCEKIAGNAIRRELRLTMGVQSVRDVPRCEYNVALQTVRLWDDYRAMKTMKGKTK